MAKEGIWQIKHTELSVTSMHCVKLLRCFIAHFPCIQDRNAVQRKPEALPVNHFCRGKATSITYSECVCSLSYPAYNEREPYYIAICGLCDPTVLYHTISQMARLSGKKVIEQKPCVLIFSATTVETFFILRRIQRDTVITYRCDHAKYPSFLSYFNKP